MNKGGKITSGILMDPQRAMLSVLQAACFAEGSSLRHSAEETLQEDKEGPGPDSTVLNRKTPMAHDKDGNVQAGKVDTGKDGKGVEEKTSHPTKASGEGSKGSKK